MTQSAEKVIDHEMLFRQPEYTEMFENKQKNFEYKHAEEKIIEIREWTKTKEYQEKNFAREALTVADRALEPFAIADKIDKSEPDNEWLDKFDTALTVGDTRAARSARALIAKLAEPARDGNHA